MIKPVSTLSIIVAGVMCIAPTFGAQMTPQIQRLLDQKQEKIKKLEECEGKKQGWMIAGISTIGVTAVGVGLNIVQASKRNRLDDEINTARHDLEKKREDLSSIQNQISEKEREKAAAEKEKAERERAEQVAREQAEREKSGVDGVIGKECNDGKGLWFTALNGNDKKCSDSTGAIVDCKCVEMTNFTPASGLGSGVENNPAEKPKASKTGGSEKSDKPGDGKKASGETGDSEKTEESEYTVPSYNPYGESGECKGEHGDRVTSGCTCKSAKGLVSRFNSLKGDNFCECQNGKTWDAGQDKCVDIKKAEKKEEETPKYQLPSYSFDYALPVTSGNCAAITRCSDVKTFIPKTEEELKCLKQNCDNIGGKWRQEHKLTYVCMC